MRERQGYSYPVRVFNFSSAAVPWLGQSPRLAILLLAYTTLTAQTPPSAANPAVRLNADVLLRADNVTNLSDRGDFRRVRAWLRPGFDLSPAAWLRFGARGSFALGSDQNRDNILRSDNFHSDDVSLDRLYVAAEKGGLEVGGGKFAMPFQLSEMIWDYDIQPSGLYGVYRRSALALRAGVFHRSHIHHDRSTVAGGEASVNHRLTPNWIGEVEAALITFNALDQFQPGMERQNRARLVEGRLRYLSAFKLASGRYLAVYRGFAGWPVSLESSYVHNFGARDQRRAVEALIRLGELGRPGDWSFSYSFQRVERDAVVGAFTSDDWWFHSDHQGSRITAAYKFLPHVTVRFHAVFQKRILTPDMVKRFQLDLAAQF